MTGIDISERMIEEAKKKTATEECKVEYFVQDMRKLNLNRTFDCAICMFGGFGYILTYTDLVSAFSGLRRHLKKNGIFVFEF